MELSLKKKGKASNLINRRLFERIPTSIDIKFFYGNLFYSGTVLNISEKGMFINTKRCLPYEAMFVVIFDKNSALFKMIVKVKRIATCEDPYGMGVELVSPSTKYLEFVNNLKVH